jgi:hypothetical protein
MTDVVVEPVRVEPIGSVEAGWPANLKALFDQHLRDVERERQQDNDWHAFLMEQARDNSVIKQRLAHNAISWDNLVLAGETDATAQGSMASTLANQMRSVAFEAVQSALGMTSQTAAPAQGTTGVAQAALQTQVAPELAQIILNANTVQTALLSELAKIEQALSVILVKVTGEAVAK